VLFVQLLDLGEQSVDETLSGVLEEGGEVTSASAGPLELSVVLSYGLMAISRRPSDDRR